MELDKVHLRHCMLYEFQQGYNATEATRNLCNVLGEGVVDVRTVQRWFSKFRAGNFNFDDKPHTGRPSDFNDDILKALLLEDPHLSSREIEEKMGYDHTTIARHINKLGYVQKLGQWVPRELNENQLANRFTICSSLLLRQNFRPFLDRLIIGDVKWITYDVLNRKRGKTLSVKRNQSIAKSNINRKKRILAIWWDRKGLIYCNLLSQGQNITSDIYCEMLSKLKEEIKKKRPIIAKKKEFLIQHDNARSYITVKTMQKLDELGFEVLSHPPHSPDIAPSDYHLFLSLQNFISEKKFKSEDELNNALFEFFYKEDEKFFASGINKLPSRWKQVIDNNGDYINN